jgi:hypothetical protein
MEGRNHLYVDEMIGRSDYRRAAQQCFYVCGPADDSDFVADVITDVQEAGLANARLIAAAPDLLEACEAFLEKWQRQGLDANLQLEKFDTLARQMEAAVEAAACPSHVEVKPVELAAVACRPTSPHVSPAAHQEGGALGGAPESGD